MMVIIQFLLILMNYSNLHLKYIVLYLIIYISVQKPTQITYHYFYTSTTALL